eukprot:m51a1_g4671 hypothetical protein (140) ;mRNA; r:118878-119297
MVKYAIQSRSSGGYLDGRNPGMSQPLITYRPPQNDAYLQWHLVAVGTAHFAIQSVSSGGCLDGRNPGMSELLVTYRPPIEEDHYLHWSLVPVADSGAVAIVSRSSGGFLDGRNPGMADPLITYRPPRDDQYLHWVIIPL